MGVSYQCPAQYLLYMKIIYDNYFTFLERIQRIQLILIQFGWSIFFLIFGSPENFQLHRASCVAQVVEHLSRKAPSSNPSTADR
jgi:hypothetical protein